MAIPKPAHFNFSRDVVEQWASRRPDALALWAVHDGLEEKLSFARLNEQARRAASWFDQLGIQRGERVLLQLPRVPSWWVSLLGLTRLGAVPIPCTCLLTTQDLKYRLAASDACAIITDAEGAAKADALPFTHRILVGSEHAGWVSFEQGVRQANPRFDPEPTRSDDPGIIYFTSGTTGPPKMVLHTQASYGLGHRITGQLWLDLKPDDLHWCITDTGWAKAAWSCVFGPWQMGACVFTIDSRGKFDASSALKTLSSYPISTWCAPPTALRLIVREDLSRYRFPQLRHCVSAGEPLNPEVIAAWQRATGLTLYDGYGQTETVLLVGNFRSSGEPLKPGSMGKPSPGFELALLDDEGRELPAGQEGEIAVRTRPNRPLGLFQEYWRNPQENALRFRGDFYLTGDRARRDESGYYWFVGRGDDVIKSAAYRIGPFEVESALIEHPAVVEAAVVGKPDETRGQIVKAFVVLRNGRSPCEELKRELQDHCKRVTAPYKYPREIEFVTELPKTISGKIRRVELRRNS